MANRFWNFVLKFTPGTLAKAEDVNTNLTGINTGLDDVASELDQSIQVTNAPGSTDITLNAVARALKILSFDTDGNIVAVDDMGDWQGNHAAATDYVARDLVKDAAGDLGLNNIYRCNAGHTSTGTMADNAAKWDLVVDVTDSVAAALLSQQWAALTTGIVDTTDYSSKAYAVGGVGVDGVIGSAKHWAAYPVGFTVDGALYSSRHYSSEAAGSAAGALASLEEFDSKYYGPRTDAQETNLDPNGDASTDGDIYWNTTIGRMKVYNSGAWQLTTADAVDVNVADADNKFLNVNVETVLRELYDLKVTANLLPNGNFEAAIDYWTTFSTTAGALENGSYADSISGETCRYVWLVNNLDTITKDSRIFPINPLKPIFFGYSQKLIAGGLMQVDYELLTYDRAGAYVATYPMLTTIASIASWETNIADHIEPGTLGDTEVFAVLRAAYSIWGAGTNVEAVFDDYIIAQDGVAGNEIYYPDAAGYLGVKDVSAALNELGRPSRGYNVVANAAAPDIDMAAEVNYLSGGSAGGWTPVISNALNGRKTTFIINNTTSTDTDITYNGAWNHVNKLPDTVPGGSSIVLNITCNGSAGTGVYIEASGPKEDLIEELSGAASVVTLPVTAEDERTLEFEFRIDTTGSAVTFIELNGVSANHDSKSVIDGLSSSYAGILLAGFSANDTNTGYIKVTPNSADGRIRVEYTVSVFDTSTGAMQGVSYGTGYYKGSGVLSSIRIRNSGGSALFAAGSFIKLLKRG